MGTPMHEPLGALERNMNCREFVDSIRGYLDDELPPDSRLGFERHADRCDGCAAYLSSYRQTIRLAREALTDPEDDGSDRDAIPELLRAVLEARKPPRG